MPQAASLTDVPVSYDLLAAYLSTRMNVATVHYHLNQGGVTQVIANQVVSIAQVLLRYCELVSKGFSSVVETENAGRCIILLAL